VYLRQIGFDIFEYLTAINGEVYGAHIEIVRPWYKRLLRIELSEKQVNAALNQVYAMAETTIETITGNVEVSAAKAGA
jgi:hypothetical protein